MLNVLLLFVAAYAVICVGAWKVHRHFVYVPDRSYVQPADMGLEGVEEIKLRTPDGLTLIVWYVPARRGMPTLLYFTGNGGSAATRAHKIAAIKDRGYGLLMLNYRSFGGSEGSPTETDNVADAQLAYDWLREQGIAADDIVAYGESLGTSVATQLATKRQASALVLEAPFSTIVEVGRQTWWFLPLKLVMVDQYRSIDYIGDVHAPLLIMHGTDDSVIPIAQAKALFEAANEPKTMKIFEGGDHNDLYDHGALDEVERFLKSLRGTAQPHAALDMTEPATAVAAG